MEKWQRVVCRRSYLQLAAHSYEQAQEGTEGQIGGAPGTKTQRSQTTDWMKDGWMDGGVGGGAAFYCLASRGQHSCLLKTDVIHIDWKDELQRSSHTGANLADFETDQNHWIGSHQQQTVFLNSQTSQRKTRNLLW